MKHYSAASTAGRLTLLLRAVCPQGGPSPGSDGGCAICEEGVNYTAPAVSPRGWYSVKSLGMGDSWNQADCAELCAATDGCAAIVWTAPKTCSFRTAEEVAAGKLKSNGTTACIPADLRSLSVSVPATVPGDLVTDLQRAGKILDPLSSNNHKDPSQVQWWNGAKYTYSKNFSVGASMRGAASVRLVLNSVKMGSTISLNGHILVS